jgi:hypothetical protein
MARPGFVRTNIVRWVKEGSEASFLSQMRDLRRLALNADGTTSSPPHPFFLSPQEAQCGMMLCRFYWQRAPVVC